MNWEFYWEETGITKVDVLQKTKIEHLKHSKNSSKYSKIHFPNLFLENQTFLKFYSPPRTREEFSFVTNKVKKIQNEWSILDIANTFRGITLNNMIIFKSRREVQIMKQIISFYR
jgi:hypothetical protein